MWVNLRLAVRVVWIARARAARATKTEFAQGNQIIKPPWRIRHESLGTIVPLSLYGEVAVQLRGCQKKRFGWWLRPDRQPRLHGGHCRATDNLLVCFVAVSCAHQVWLGSQLL